MLLPIQGHVAYCNYFWTPHFKKDSGKPQWHGDVSREVLETRTMSYGKLLLETRVLS